MVAQGFRFKHVLGSRKMGKVTRMDALTRDQVIGIAKVGLSALQIASKVRSTRRKSQVRSRTGRKVQGR